MAKRAVKKAKPVEPRGWRKENHDESRPWSPDSPQHKHKFHTLAHLVTFVLALQEKLMAVDQTVTDALAAQDQKLADLSKKVDDFIASHGANSAADNASIVAGIQAEGAAVDGISAKLNPPA